MLDNVNCQSYNTHITKRRKTMRNNIFETGTIFWSNIRRRQNKSFIENSAKEFLLNDRYIK